MHLVIPYAAPPPDAVAEGCAGLRLRSLGSVLALLAPGAVDQAEEDTLSPPHERALARALGWPVRDGLLPWAAHAAPDDGIAAGGLAWGLVVPAHWQLGRDRVVQLDPAALGLTDAESRAYCDLVRPSFAAHGWALHWGAALRWYAAHDSLADLACASLDRALGRNVDLWLARSPQARRLRRLQAEVQMLLHDHPLNTARAERGALPLNSFWLSGCGRALPAGGPGAMLDDRLRAPQLARDWPAWRAAWETLDAGPVAALLAHVHSGGAARLTLCGERSAADFGPARRSAVLRLAGRWRGRSGTEAAVRMLGML